MPYATAEAPIFTPPVEGSWNELLYDFVTVVDATPYHQRAPEADVGRADTIALEPATSQGSLEVGLAPRSESNLFAGFDGVDGVFVATWDDFEIGAHVDLAIDLPGGTRIDVIGRVEFTREPCGLGGPGVGLRFVGLNERHARLLSRFAELREPIFHA